jgi:prevent-host-death family protein
MIRAGTDGASRHAPLPEFLTNCGDRFSLIWQKFHELCQPTTVYPLTQNGQRKPDIYGYNLWTFCGDAMKAVPAAEFKNRCLALLEEVQRTRRPLVVTRHGKPVAEVSAYVESGSGKSNPLKGSIEYQGDLVSPLGEHWDADA